VVVVGLLVGLPVVVVGLVMVVVGLLVVAAVLVDLEPPKCCDGHHQMLPQMKPQ
jgi:hypothetical protein